MGWERARPEDFRAEDDKPLTGGHRFIPISKRIAWPTYCARCGHVPLKNDISRLVTAIGCGYERDVRYQRWAQQNRKVLSCRST